MKQANQPVQRSGKVPWILLPFSLILLLVPSQQARQAASLICHDRSTGVSQSSPPLLPSQAMVHLELQAITGELQGQHQPPVLANSPSQREGAPLLITHFPFSLPRQNQLLATVCLRIQVELQAAYPCLLQRLAKPLIIIDQLSQFHVFLIPNQTDQSHQS